MKKRKIFFLIRLILLLIPLGFITFVFFLFRLPVHEELIDSIHIPNKDYMISAYYCDQGAAGDWTSIRKEYKNGKSYSIYYLDDFNDVRKLKLVNGNKLKVVLGPKVDPDTILIDLDLLEIEKRKAFLKTIIVLGTSGILMLIGISIIVFRRGFRYTIYEKIGQKIKNKKGKSCSFFREFTPNPKKRSDYMVRYGIILIIMSLYLFVFLSRMLR